MSAKNLFARTAVVSAATLAIALAGAAAPAQAASSITAKLFMTVDHAESTAVIEAHLPMNQFDAQGYINNGARIEIRCYGDDYFFDNQLFPTRTFDRTSAPGPGVSDRLVARADGVHLLTAITFLRGHEFNEDLVPEPDGDEVYCKATWIDGAGDTLAAFTAVEHGLF